MNDQESGIRTAVDQALNDLPQPASPYERARWRIVSQATLVIAEPLIRADERRRIAEGIHIGGPGENVPSEERLGLYRLAAADGVLAERQRWQAKLDAIRALLTSGPIGRASGERYIRADLIRSVLDAQPEHLTETEQEQQ
jgi:hypothetical protein